MSTKKFQEPRPKKLIELTDEQLKKISEEGMRVRKELEKRARAMTAPVNLEKEVRQLKLDNNRLKERIDELVERMSRLEHQVYHPWD